MIIQIIDAVIDGLDIDVFDIYTWFFLVMVGFWAGWLIGRFLV